jgi:hypothetical protein
MAAPAKKKRTCWQWVVYGFKAFIEWVEDTFSDPAIARTILEDLGLPPDTPLTPPEKVPPEMKGKIDEYLNQVDPDQMALGETVLAIAEAYESISVFLSSLEDEEVTPWELFWTLTQVWVTEPLRVRNPAAYAVLKALGMITGEYDTVDRFDPALVVSTLKGEPVPPDYGERLAQRISALFGVAAVAFAQWRQEATSGDTMFEAFYGWDPDPDTESPLADLISERTGTMVLRLGGTLNLTVALTAAGVTSAQGGPGLFLGLSGEMSETGVEGTQEWTVTLVAPGGAWFYIPFRGSTLDFDAGGAVSNAIIRLRVRQIEPRTPGETPPLPGQAIAPTVLAITDATRLELAGFEFVVEAAFGRAGLRVAIAQGKLVIALGDGDGFLASLPGETVEFPFSLGVILDTDQGLRIEGGTRLRANLPLGASIKGVFTLQYLELSAGRSPTTDGVALELSAGMSLDIGPFQASVDRLGILVDSGGIPQEDFGAITDTVRLKPPTGIGLLLDAGAAKGGGFLYGDTARHEYAGVLEVELDLPIVGKITVKAIGILTTELPDRDDGWALLLLLFAQFRWDLGWGFTLNGLGGIIGLHHRPDPLALTEGLTGGLMDDLLFPENPVADAPRILPRLRTVFPIEQNTFTIGPVIELGWGTPTYVHLRLGLLFEIDNALGGPDPSSLSKVILLGQLLIQVPAKDLGVPPLVRFLVDILGWYDYDEDWFYVRARLRDSKIAGFALTGDLVYSSESDENGDPTMIFAVGGFHPSFVDVPRGVPATMDRVGFGLALGPVRLECKFYYALSPNAKHLGINIEVKAKLGPVTIEGYVGFDALADTETDRFVAQCRFGVALKFKGKSLCGVKVEMVLTGPGEWHAVGAGRFEILWWDHDFDFDERWGDEPEVSTITIALREILAGQLSEARNWTARLPAGMSPPVTVEIPATGLTVHPLGELTFLQRTVPLGIEVQRVGAKRVAGGPVTFTAGAATVNGSEVGTAAVLDHFAPGQFLDLDDDRALTAPSFERFEAGLTVGVPGFRVPGAASGLGRAPLTFEDRYLVPEDEPHPDPDPRGQRWKVISRGTVADLTLEAAGAQARSGGAGVGRSPRQFAAALAGDASRRATVAHPPLALVDAVALTPTGEPAPATSTAGAQLAGSRPGVVLVEAWETVG